MNGMADSAKPTRDLICLGGLDDPWKRLPIVAIIALAAWLLLLTICGFLLNGLVPAATGNSAIDARLIMVPGKGSVSNGSAAVESKYEPSEEPLSSAAAIAPVLRTPHSRTETAANYSAAAASHAHAATRRARSNNLWREPHREEVIGTNIDHTEHSNAARQPPTQNHMTATTTESSVNKPEMRPKIGRADDVSSAPAASLGSGSSAESAHAGWSSAKGGSDGNGYGPKPIYAPVPAIPDDMRDQVLEATAIVRFHVALDGSAKVALITRTEYMTLDQLILDTLRKWRFQPAMRNGAAVESDAEVRLRITVQ